MGDESSKSVVRWYTSQGREKGSEEDTMSKMRVGPNVYIPMPVSLVGSVVNERPNFMPVGWVTRVNRNPPYIGVGINKAHYTPTGIREKGAFSVNFPPADLVTETDYCGIVSGKNTDKSTLFELFYGESKTAPMINRCPLCLECKLVDIHEMPTNVLFIGEIIAVYTEEEYLTNGQPDVKKMNLMILTMPDNNYWSIGEHVGEAWKIGNRLRQEKHP
jgi:flavin reductase (DIM6/NTAB) family NADH-FMN oxidoreductase RutF